MQPVGAALHLTARCGRSFLFRSSLQYVKLIRCHKIPNLNVVFFVDAFLTITIRANLNDKYTAFPVTASQ